MRVHTTTYLGTSVHNSTEIGQDPVQNAPSQRRHPAMSLIAIELYEKR